MNIENKNVIKSLSAQIDVAISDNQSKHAHTRLL